MLEDLLVQALQLGAGLDADLLHQPGARVAVGGERLRLPAGAVEREHALGVQVLAQRVGRDERVELADHLDVAAGLEVGVDRHLGRAQPQLLEAADLGGGERLVRDVGERVAAPQRQRLARARLLEQALEADRVDGSLRQLAARSRGRGWRSGVAVEHPPQMRDVELHHLRPRWAAARRPTSPPRAGRPTRSGPPRARASRGRPAACGGPARRARPRGEPRAAPVAARPSVARP